MEAAQAFENLVTTLNQLASALSTQWDRLRWYIVIAVILYLVVQILIIIAIVNYAAVKNSETFDYDRLAKQIAKELRKGEKQE